MKLLTLRIHKLHGHISTKIDFQPDLSLLVGINGSGKTSALNVINWMFNLDIRKLTSEHFDSIVIRFQNLNKVYRFSASQCDMELTISLQNETETVDFENIRFKLDFERKLSAKRLSNHRIRTFSDSLQSNLFQEEQQILSFLRGIEPPMIIGLDRTLYTNSGGYFNIQRGSFDEEIPNSTTSEKLSPLQTVVQLLRRRFNHHTNQLLKLNRVLNETIVLSAFDDIWTDKQLIQFINQKPPTLKTIETLQTKVVSFLVDNHNWNSRKNELFGDASLGNVPEQRIENWFNKLKIVVAKKESEKNNLEYIVNISQFKKVNELIKAFSDFEQKTQHEIAPLNEFIDVLNGFFKDSAKQLYFEKETGLIRYNTIDREGNVVQEAMNITTLSSGEKQILILFTYIKYRSENLFLIDEPELSLHIKWQEEFLNAINKIKRKHSQLIIATHSPEIIGKFRENCSVLIPYEN